MRSLLPLLVAVLFTGCGTQSCTEVGCADGVGIDVTSTGLGTGERVQVHMCVDGRCADREAIVASAAHRRRGLRVMMPLPDEQGNVRLRARITRSSGAVIDAAGTGYASISHPNGPDCPPACHQVAAVFEAGRLVEA